MYGKSEVLLSTPCGAGVRAMPWTSGIQACGVPCSPWSRSGVRAIAAMHGARNAGDELDGAQPVLGDALCSFSCRSFVACTHNAPLQQSPPFASFTTRLAWSCMCDSPGGNNLVLGLTSCCAAKHTGCMSPEDVFELIFQAAIEHSIIAQAAQLLGKLYGRSWRPAFPIGGLQRAYQRLLMADQQPHVVT